MSADIIQFPRSPTFHPSTKGEIEDSVTTMRMAHVHQTLGALMEMIFERLYAGGFDFTSMTGEDDLKSAELILESLHSLMLKKYGIEHPFQALAENLFVLDEEEDEFTLTDEVHMSFESVNK